MDRLTLRSRVRAAVGVGRGSNASFVLRLQPFDGGTVLQLGGELDVTFADRVESVVSVGTLRDGDLIVDLGGVTFCDCAGLKALERLLSTLATSGRVVRLGNASSAVERLLQLLGTSMSPF